MSKDIHMKYSSTSPVLNSFLRLSAVLAVLILPSDCLRAADPQPTGDEVLQLARMSQALQDLSKLKGKLRDDDTGKEFPMELTMRDNVIRFMFRDPNEIINLDLNNNGTTLSRIVAGGKVEMPLSLYSDSVRGTDINYEDLSMRFLYWPKAKITGEDSVQLQKCWIVRITNPDGRGPYGTVDAWIAKSSGAIMQMEAYDAKGKRAKRFIVRKAQKYKGAYILRQMRVESFDAKEHVKGRTYLEIEDPE